MVSHTFFFSPAHDKMKNIFLNIITCSQFVGQVLRLTFQVMNTFNCSNAMNWLGIQILDNWSGCLRVILPKVMWPETRVMLPKI